MIDLTVVIPAYKENVQALTKMYAELKMLGCDVVIVDDGSHMSFPEEVNVITYPANMGYGYAIKQGIKYCKTPIVCTMDADGQHTVDDVRRLYWIYKLREDISMVVGQRWLNYEKWHRWFFRKVLNFIASIITGHYLSDLNSGLRVFDAKLANDYSPILCDTFSFTTSLSISMVADGHKVCYFPIDVQKRNFGKSHVRLVRDGFITLFFILFCGIGCRTRGLRNCLRRSR